MISPADDRRVPALPGLLALVVGLAMLVTAVLALVKASGLPFGRDEVATIAIAHRSLGGTLDILFHYEGNGTLFYLVMSAWLHLGGTDELWTRLPVIACAVAAVPALALLARRLFDDTVACIAVVLLALNFDFLQLAIEARAYTPTLLVTLLAFLALVRAVDERTASAWLLYALAAIVLVWTNLLGVFIVGSQVLAIALLRRERRPQGEALPGLALAVVGCLPMVVYALTRDEGQTSWIPPVGVGDVGRLYSSWSNNHVVTVLFAVAAAFGLAGIVRGTRSRRDAEHRWPLELVGLWLVGLPLALLVISVVFQPLWIWPYVTAAVPALLIAVAVGIRSLGRPALIAAATLVVVLALAPSFVSGVRGASKSEDLRAAADEVLAGERPGDAVAYAPGFARIGVAYYLDRDRGARPLPADVEEVPGDPNGSQGREFGSEDTEPHVAARLRTHPRVWLVGYSGAAANWHPTPEPMLAFERAGGLRAFRSAGAWHWGQITVRLERR